jgi:hypothetical protein
MPGYYEKALKRFQHAAPSVPEDAPHAWDPPKYGTTVQYANERCGRICRRTRHTDTSPSIDASKTKLVQEVVGTFLYSARAVDPTMWVALSSIATQQNNVTEDTMPSLSYYAATRPNPMIRFKRSDMQREVTTDTSYLSLSKSCSRAGGHHCLSNKPPDRPIEIVLASADL